MQYIYLDYSKLKVNKTYENDETITKSFETSDVLDERNKTYIGEKLIEVFGHMSLVEHNYHEVYLSNKKHSVEEILIERAVKTTK